MSKKQLDEAQELAETKAFAERFGISAEKLSPVPREEIERMNRATRANVAKLRAELIAEAKAIEEARRRVVF